MKTYKDIYKFPLINLYGRVSDSNGNFVFQFVIDDEEKQDITLKVINGDMNFKNQNLIFKHDGGYINVEDESILKPIILIRGWGNLTGVGGHNLSAEEAANIQDTFAEFIVTQLNKRTVL